MTITTNYTRVFVGDVARWPRERQLETCRKIEPDIKAIYEPHEFDEYVKNTRKDEIALISQLVALAEKKPKKRPGVSFVLRLLALLDKCAYIHDADTGVRSIDGQAWLDHVESTFNSITQGRKLPTEEAKRIGKIGLDAREAGLVADWKGRKGEPEYMAVAHVWGNLSIKPAAYAISQLPDKELQSVHPSTMKRIFGTRRECLEYLNNK